MRWFGISIAIGLMLATPVGRAADMAASGPVGTNTESATLKDAIENKLPANKWRDILTLDLTANGTIQGSLNADSHLSDRNHTDASGKLSLGATLSLWAEDSLYIKIRGGDGSGLDGQLPSFSGFNDETLDGNKVELSEYWYETMQFENRLVIKIGKIDLTGSTCSTEDSFDENLLANDGSCQFMSSAFVNNMALEFPQGNTPAVVAWYQPAEFFHCGVGLARAKDEWSDVLDKPFGIAQLEFIPGFGGRVGNYRVYAWLNNNDHTKLLDESDTTAKGYGFGLSFDQALTDILSAFCRYGWERPEVYTIGQALSLGLQVAGSCYGRNADAIGLAYGLGLLSADFKDVSDVAGINAGNEQHAELYYSIAVNKYLAITPDIQWVLNPSGDKDNSNVWVLGTRAVVEF